MNMIKNKNQRTLGGLGLLFLGIASLGSCGGASEPRPNLLVISIDTLRPDFLSCYGHERVTSPRIDRFAAQGVRFNDVTSASPWTLPSHASLLTGLYPSSHGVKDHDRQLTRGTLATRLKEEGYQTMAVVNTHNIGDPRFGLLRGFQSPFYVEEAEADPNRPSLVGNSGAKVTKRGLRLLSERDQDLPFFLFLHYYDVHTDFSPDPKWELEYVDSYDGELTGNTQQLIKYRFDDVQMDPKDARWLEQMYEAEIRTFDEVIGRVFDYLDANQLSDNTLVVITSDHGEEYMEHGSVLHGRTYYEEVIRIPLLVRGPGVPVGAQVDEAVHLIDIAPMIFTLLGVAPELEMDGVDLSTLFGPTPKPLAERALYAEADHNNRVDGKDRSDIKRMIRRGHDKLIYDTITGKKELYDLKADPLELEDLALSQPERTEALWIELKAFIERPDTSGVNILTDEMSQEDIDKLERLGYGGGDDEEDD